MAVINQLLFVDGARRRLNKKTCFFFSIFLMKKKNYKIKLIELLNNQFYYEVATRRLKLY